MVNHTIIGRLAEKKTLEKLYKSERSEFVAVYGRRRVGKTFLLKELFQYSMGLVQNELTMDALFD